MKHRKLRLSLLLGMFFFLGFAMHGDIQITIDGDFRDWENIPSIASFSPTFSPEDFQREWDGKAGTVKIGEALYWNRAGTDLQEVKSYVSDAKIYLYLESFSSFTDELSIYYYLYTKRDATIVNSYTIELIPGMGSRPAMVLLWEKGRILPEKIGELKNGNAELDCILPMKDLPVGMSQGLSDDPSFDLTTCYHESVGGLFEEFYFITLYYRDVLQAEDLK